jgi:hypothetical protein
MPVWLLLLLFVGGGVSGGIIVALRRAARTLDRILTEERAVRSDQPD